MAQVKGLYGQGGATVTGTTSGAGATAGDVVVVMSYEGGTPSDTKGLSYQLDCQEGMLRVYSAVCPSGVILASSDTITIPGSRLTHVWVISDVRAVERVHALSKKSGSHTGDATNINFATPSTDPFGAITTTRQCCIFAFSGTFSQRVFEERDGLWGATPFPPWTGYSTQQPIPPLTSSQWDGSYTTRSIQSALYEQKSAAAAGTYQATGGHECRGSGNYSLIHIAYIDVNVPYTPDGSASAKILSFDRGILGRRIVARVSSGAALARRYNDALPEAVAETVTVAASGASALCVRARRSGEWDLMTVESGAVKLYTSYDQGRTWTLASTVQASGAAGVTQCDDPSRGRKLAAYYDSANTRWLLKVGQLDAAGTTWSWSAAQVLVTSAQAQGELRLQRAGVYEFLYLTSGGAEVLLTCNQLSNAGVGTWS